MTTRSVMREVLVDYLEQRRYAMLHASAFAAGRRVVVVVGNAGSGKTTLAIKAALRHGCRLIANDHLVV